MAGAGAWRDDAAMPDDAPLSALSLTPTALDERRWLALLALALGGFGIGATEFVAMGLLPDLARDLLPGLAAADPEQAIARSSWLIRVFTDTAAPGTTGRSA